MQTFIIILIVTFAILAYVDELLSAIGLRKPYPTIVGPIVFYISVTLGILYISKLFWVLFVLDFIHPANKDDWDKYPLYRAFDYTVCMLGFLYQLYVVIKFIY